MIEYCNLIENFEPDVAKPVENKPDVIKPNSMSSRASFGSIRMIKVFELRNKRAKII
jgi:hypothetical protein